MTLDQEETTMEANPDPERTREALSRIALTADGPRETLPACRRPSG